jgi:hypothetical protein
MRYEYLTQQCASCREKFNVPEGCVWPICDECQFNNKKAKKESKESEEKLKLTQFEREARELYIMIADRFAIIDHRLMNSFIDDPNAYFNEIIKQGMIRNNGHFKPIMEVKDSLNSTCSTCAGKLSL